MGEMVTQTFAGKALPKNEMAVMDGTGDTKILWDSHNADEVEAARAQFNALRAKGFLAYKVVGKEGTKGEMITQFDPDAEKIVLSPPLRGG